jgi:hypothetical protein
MPSRPRTLYERSDTYNHAHAVPAVIGVKVDRVTPAAGWLARIAVSPFIQRRSRLFWVSVSGRGVDSSTCHNAQDALPPSMRGSCAASLGGCQFRLTLHFFLFQISRELATTGWRSPEYPTHMIPPWCAFCMRPAEETLAGAIEASGVTIIGHSTRQFTPPHSIVGCRHGSQVSVGTRHDRDCHEARRRASVHSRPCRFFSADPLLSRITRLGNGWGWPLPSFT